jgi:DNA-binding MarR family transcriptional regulator
LATDDCQTATESARRSLARFELAAIRMRNVMRLRLGVSDDELAALLHLAEHSKLTQGRLVAVGTLSRSGVGAMVQRLEDAGMIERLPDPTDKRVRLLQLSPKGARRLREACGACDDNLERLLGRRSQEELDVLARLLTELAEATERHAGAAEQDPALAGTTAGRLWEQWS